RHHSHFKFGVHIFEILASSAYNLYYSQTSTHPNSVHLIGSWDNFTKHYPMERDIRRARSQWRGCYAFENIICDGDGESSPTRSGGLKMGSTYYYYYELDDGTEIHDPSIPSTTTCPYMPGQPVNLLWVPVEVQPLRFRSASESSMANGDLKTMNPADKFMTPRQPPPTPTLPRLNTSPMVRQKRSARSLSPRSEKGQWSPRTFFGIRLPSSATVPDLRERGRSPSLKKMSKSESTLSLPSVRSCSERKGHSVPHTRDVSPQSYRRANSHSREPSPLRQLAVSESISSYNPALLEIPDEIAEEAEDDDNFASVEEGFTCLSPPPSGLRSPPARSFRSSTEKPLPQLPGESFLPLVPAPLSLPPATDFQPRSHFSTSTISTLSSPTNSQSEFSSTNSVSDSLDEEDLAADMDISSGEDFMYSPVLLDGGDGRGFNGYSLPSGEYASEHTLRKETPIGALDGPASRTTFGGAEGFEERGEVRSVSALEELLSEMGYLGDVIAK
ncbi:hypothetical protein D0Z07_1268, partial [Hyphodiscus hymeniophilus]